MFCLPVLNIVVGKKNLHKSADLAPDFIASVKMPLLKKISLSLNFYPAFSLT